MHADCGGGQYYDYGCNCCSKCHLCSCLPACMLACACQEHACTPVAWLLAFSWLAGRAPPVLLLVVDSWLVAHPCLCRELWLWWWLGEVMVVILAQDTTGNTGGELLGKLPPPPPNSQAKPQDARPSCPAKGKPRGSRPSCSSPCIAHSAASKAAADAAARHWFDDIPLGRGLLRPRSAPLLPHTTTPPPWMAPWMASWIGSAQHLQRRIA